MTTAPAKPERTPEKPKLGYLELPPDFDFEVSPRGDDFRDKFKTKVKSNPFVPIGLLATTCALTYGIYQMRTGNRAMSQKMMRLRVVAQGFTVVALLGGVLYEATKKSPMSNDT